MGYFEGKAVRLYVSPNIQVNAVIIIDFRVGPVIWYGHRSYALFHNINIYFFLVT